MSSSAPSRYGLFIVSAVVLALAAGIWNERSQRNATHHSATQERLKTQTAASLLIGAFVADNQLKYSATSHTAVTYGPKEMNTEAKLTRTPESLSIVYLKGANEGLHTGFNQKWFWRQSKPGAPMKAYAAVQVEAPLMAARRIALMLQNYSVQHIRSDEISGRPIEVLEIRPLHHYDGSSGPGKIIGIDRETGLTLLTETYNYQWRRVMRSKLSKIDFSPNIDAHTFASKKEMFDAAKKTPWTVHEMGKNRAEVTRITGVEPPNPNIADVVKGFRFDGVGIHLCDPKDPKSMVALSRYTDGLNTLTIFAMKRGAAETKGVSPEQACDFGPGTLVMRSKPQGYLIAVADLPQRTLERVLDTTQISLAR